MPPISNFAPIEAQLPDVAEAGQKAEQEFVRTPRSAMMFLRMYGERLAVHLLQQHRLPAYQEDQASRLRRLRVDANLDTEALQRLHVLREEGNRAVHGDDVSHSEAMRMLKAAHRLSTWYWATYTPQHPPAPSTFVRPVAPDARVSAQLERAALEAQRREAERAKSELDAVRRLLDMPEVAINRTVETCFQALDPALQERVQRYLTEFKEEPIHEDRPLRVPPGMADPKVRFADVEGLTLVVIAPDRGDVLLVVFLGDEATATTWAQHKCFEVNRVFGSVQSYDAVEAQELAANCEGGLLDGLSDEDLLRVALPSALLEPVRALANEQDLDALAPTLPPEAADALYLLACGYTVDQTLRELNREPPREPVDHEDFAVAVHHPASQRSFKVLDGDEDLESVLSGSVEAWRVYLHPDQRKYVRMKAKGPIRILGGAGTGKTVALLHRAKHLLTTVFTEPDDRLLITTYTRNLAADLRHHLAKLLDDETLARVDVVNLHALLADLWREHGDGRRLLHDAHPGNAWKTAVEADTLRLSQAFYEDEWTQVVQAQDALTLSAYQRARRDGRGGSLSRTKRAEVWRVFEAYRAALDRDGVLERADQARALEQQLTAGTLPRRYVSALVDEVQDFEAPELKFLRALIAPAPNDLFLVGDTHQRIYGYPVRIGRCGIEVRGRARRLRVNYRTTAKVRS